MSGQAVEKDKLVTIAVTMADMTGRVLEETGPEGITYLHGHGDIFPKIEQALEGRFPGEGFSIALQPEDAFGEYDADAIRMVPLAELGDPDSIVPGLQFEQVPGEPADGRVWRITDVAEGVAILEANHPLAGCGLQFAVKVLKVETPEGDEVGSDDVVVPGFLGLADKLVSEDDDEPSEEELRAERDAFAAAMAKPVRIVR